MDPVRNKLNDPQIGKQTNKQTPAFHPVLSAVAPWIEANHWKQWPPPHRLHQTAPGSSAMIQQPNWDFSIWKKDFSMWVEKWGTSKMGILNQWLHQKTIRQVWDHVLSSWSNKSVFKKKRGIWHTICTMGSWTKSLVPKWRASYINQWSNWILGISHDKPFLACGFSMLTYIAHAQTLMLLSFQLACCFFKHSGYTHPQDQPLIDRFKRFIEFFISPSVFLSGPKQASEPHNNFAVARKIWIG